MDPFSSSGDCVDMHTSPCFTLLFTFSPLFFLMPTTFLLFAACLWWWWWWWVNRHSGRQAGRQGVGQWEQVNGQWGWRKWREMETGQGQTGQDPPSSSHHLPPPLLSASCTVPMPLPPPHPSIVACCLHGVAAATTAPHLHCLHCLPLTCMPYLTFLPHHSTFFCSFFSAWHVPVHACLLYTIQYGTAYYYHHHHTHYHHHHSSFALFVVLMLLILLCVVLWRGNGNRDDDDDDV